MHYSTQALSTTKIKKNEQNPGHSPFKKCTLWSRFFNLGLEGSMAVASHINILNKRRNLYK